MTETIEQRATELLLDLPPGGPVEENWREAVAMVVQALTAAEQRGYERHIEEAIAEPYSDVTANELANGLFALAMLVKKLGGKDAYDLHRDMKALVEPVRALTKEVEG